jgi:hypothetical protein
MKNLTQSIISENEKNNAYKLELINNLDNADVSKLDWRLSDLLTAGQKKKLVSLEELKEALKSRNKKAQEKKNLKDLENLNFSNLDDIETLTINVEWKKSQMWGMNPTAEAYVNGIGHVSSGSIGGCGYDKQSTAVARVLNQVPQLIKKLYELKENNIDTKNHNLFGYGSGYGVLPSFEGGVGVSCYDRIFNAIGYTFETISNGKMFDVYRISRKKD